MLLLALFHVFESMGPVPFDIFAETDIARRFPIEARVFVSTPWEYIQEAFKKSLE